MKGLKLGIHDLNELRTYLAETPTDSGGVTVNRGLLRHLVKTQDLAEALVKAPLLDGAPHHEALCDHLKGGVQ